MRAGENRPVPSLSPFELYYLWRLDRPLIHNRNADSNGVVEGLRSEYAETIEAYQEVKLLPQDELTLNKFISEVADIFLVAYCLIQNVHGLFSTNGVANPEARIRAHLTKHIEHEDDTTLALLKRAASKLNVPNDLEERPQDLLYQLDQKLRYLEEINFTQITQQQIRESHQCLVEILIITVALMSLWPVDINDVLQAKIAYNNCQYTAKGATVKAHGSKVQVNRPGDPRLQDLNPYTAYRTKTKGFAETRKLREEFFGPIPQGTNLTEAEEDITPILAVAR